VAAGGLVGAHLPGRGLPEDLGELAVGAGLGAGGCPVSWSLWSAMREPCGSRAASNRAAREAQ
jgi:hypothetical protein